MPRFPTIWPASSTRPPPAPSSIARQPQPLRRALSDPGRQTARDPRPPHRQVRGDARVASASTIYVPRPPTTPLAAAARATGSTPPAAPPPPPHPPRQQATPTSPARSRRPAPSTRPADARDQVVEPKQLASLERAAQIRQLRRCCDERCSSRSGPQQPPSPERPAPTAATAPTHPSPAALWPARASARSGRSASRPPSPAVCPARERR